MSLLPTHILLNYTYNLICRGRERLTVQNSVVTLDPSKIEHVTYGEARKVWIGLENADIRKTTDGTDPSNTGGSEVGHIVFTNERFAIIGNADISNLKTIIKNVGETATLEIEYFYGV